MELAVFFDEWRDQNPPAEGKTGGVPIKALVYSSVTKGKWTSFRVRVLDDPLPDMIKAKVEAGETLFISVPADQGGAVVSMSVVVLEGCVEKSGDDGRAFINAKSVRQELPPTEVVANTALMSKEQLVPMPFPVSGKGNPFLMYSGTPHNPASVAACPGFHRRNTWNTGKEGELRLEVTFEQRQWKVRADVRKDMPILTMRMVLWDDQCKQLLLGGDMKREHLSAIVKANPVPFYASVCVDGKYSMPSKLSLSTLAVHWDLRTYLEKSCLELSATDIKERVPKTTSAKDIDEDIINISATGKVPVGPKWRYFAMTANRATSAKEVKEPMILYAVQVKKAEAAAEAPSDPKRQKTLDKK
jgi:hypothetical protein